MTKYQSVCSTILLSMLVSYTWMATEAAALPSAYHITDLGTLGGTESEAWGINAGGQVVGYSHTSEDGAPRAFRWTPTTLNGTNGAMAELGSFGGDSFATSINDAGHVSGFSYLGDAFLYDGALHDLGSIAGGNAVGQDINAAGQIVGWPRAFLWTPSTPNAATGLMIDLGTLGGAEAAAWGINASGQVTGSSSTTADAQTHAFLWTPTSPNGASGTMHDLGTLGGNYSSALSINDSGQVVGYSNTTGNASAHAFLWTPSSPNAATGAMLDLGTLGGTPGTFSYGSYAYGINSFGHVVGHSYADGDFDRHAFLYTSDGGMADLNSLIDPQSGWKLNFARAINDAGQIVGGGYVNGQVRAYLLTPVPEPSGVALVAAGALGLLWRRSRRRLRSLQAALVLGAAVSTANADIFQWEYINPADPSQGTQPSTTLAPDGAGANAEPGALLVIHDLTMAWLQGANLAGAYFSGSNLSYADLTGANLYGVNFSEAYYEDLGPVPGANLTGADLSGADIQGATFIYANLAGANLSQANLTGAQFPLADLTGANFDGATVQGANFSLHVPGSGISLTQLYSTASYQTGDLRGIDLYGHNLSGADLSGIDFTGSSFWSATLVGTDFSQSDLRGNLFVSANLQNADLSHTDLRGAGFAMASLTGANFTGADVRNTGFIAYHDNVSEKLTLAQLYSTASYQAYDLTGIYLPENVLDGADFTGQNLTDASFIHSTLKDANFRQAILTNVDFAQTSLRRANFSGTDLADLTFQEADLRQANLTQTNLIGAFLLRARLEGVDLTGAEIRGANFYRDSDGGGNYGSGLTPAQIYSTASYQAKDLSGVILAGSQIAGINLAGQNLTGASFYRYFDGYQDFHSAANLVGANFSEANLTDARLGAAYGQGPDLTGANFSQSNLTRADFENTTLTGANFAGAKVREANFNALGGSGLTKAQLTSTASYLAHDLRGIGLSGNRLAGIDLGGQNLTGADLALADLTGGNLSQANLTGASLGYATLSGVSLAGGAIAGASFHRDSHAGPGTGLSVAQLYSTASYQAGDLEGLTLEGDFGALDFGNHNLVDTSFKGNFAGSDFRHAQLAGAMFGHQFTPTDLAGADFSQADLAGATFKSVNLAGADLSQANLRGASFGPYYDDSGYFYSGSDLAGANLAGADVVGADFSRYFADDVGISLAQIYSTASYHARNLSGIALRANNLTGANFAGQNLTNSDFSSDDWYYLGADLTDVDLSRADLRGANLYGATLTGTNTTGTIGVDGHIAGLNLTSGKTLTVRDYDGNPKPFYPGPPLPIVVDDHLTMDSTSKLQVLLESDPWDSTISFEPGIPVSLAGTLELLFAPGTNAAALAGQTFDLFEWAGITRSGTFSVVSPYSWDLTQLYTTGEVTLSSIPLLAGDYNGDGKVDAGDYIVWRNHVGSAAGTLPNDIDGGTIGSAQYLTWKAHFGSVSPGMLQSAARVPEPTSLGLIVLAAIGMYLVGGRTRRALRGGGWA